MYPWVMIPVRGGSVGIPGKNRRNLAGKPLVSYVIETALLVTKKNKIIIVTDDAELKYLANNYNIQVLFLQKQTGDETLDQIAYFAAEHLRLELNVNVDEIFLTIQATCPFITPLTINKVLRCFENEKIKSVITVTSIKHLHWMINNNKPLALFTTRVNRQKLKPIFKESGAIIGAKISDILKNKTRIIEPIKLIKLSDKEGLDIDNPIDFKVADIFLSRKKILIKADSSIKIGMGHLYRSCAISYELLGHDVKICSNISGDKKLSNHFFDNSVYNFKSFKSDKEFVNYCVKQKPDLIILDQLNTTKNYINQLKKSKAKIITFEDMGEGASDADFLISDLYKNHNVNDKKQFYGVNYSIMNPSFEWVEVKKLNKNVKNIVILFGGTDYLNLSLMTLLALKKISFNGNVFLIQGIGKTNKINSLSKFGLNGEIYNNVEFMPEIMGKADLAISSAGRTITELMSMAIPTICLCQNEKELTHTHASQAHGVLNLGLGSFVNEEFLSKNIEFLINNFSFRKKMHLKAIKTIATKKTNKEILREVGEKIKLSLF